MQRCQTVLVLDAIGLRANLEQLSDQSRHPSHIRQHGAFVFRRRSSLAPCPNANPSNLSLASPSFGKNAVKTFGRLEELFVADEIKAFHSWASCNQLPDVD